jgi:hypothetical protein
MLAMLFHDNNLHAMSFCTFVMMRNSEVGSNTVCAAQKVMTSVTKD